MSKKNCPDQKRIRSAERALRKHNAAKRIGRSFVVIPKSVVKGHRYLAIAGLPFCQRAADLPLNPKEGAEMRKRASDRADQASVKGEDASL